MLTSPRTRPEIAAATPAFGLAWETEQAAPATPYSGPAWLRLQERLAPELVPCHAVAGGDRAFLPAYLVEAPASPDLDPRTYLGWQATGSDGACCASPTSCCASASETVDALGAEVFFPAVLVGAPGGYATEVLGPGAGPEAAAELTAALVEHAQSIGARSVAAPWLAERANGSREIAATLNGGGAAWAFWALEDYVDLAEPTYEDYLASLSHAGRRRRRKDRDFVVALDLAIRRLDDEELDARLPAISELRNANRAKNQTAGHRDEIPVLVRGLRDAGVAVLAWGCFSGEALVGFSLGFVKAGRLYMKWIGFAYGQLGERSGVYFELAVNRPVEDAFGLGLQSVELGVGAHQAKALRGCASRPVTSCTLLFDPEHRREAARLAQAYGEERLAAFGVELP